MSNQCPFCKNAGWIVITVKQKCDYCRFSAKDDLTKHNNDFKKVCPICKGIGQHSWQKGGEDVCRYCNGTGKPILK